MMNMQVMRAAVCLAAALVDPGVHAPARAGGLPALLYETGPAAAGLFPSQLSSAAWSLDSQAADDFRLTGPAKVPPGTAAFEITNVRWSGSYWQAGAALPPPDPKDVPRSFRLLFYADKFGAPASQTFDPSADALAVYDLGIGFVQEVATEGEPLKYTAPLDPPFVAAADTRYWLVVQCLMEGPTQWRWRAAAPPVGADQPAHMGNPSAGVPYWSLLKDAQNPPPQNLRFALFGVATSGVPIEPPSAPHGPDPPDDAEHQPRRLALSWQESERADVYDVYFGAAPDPPGYRGPHSAPVYYLTELLRPDTVYTWRIDARNAGGVTPGPLWSFRTAAANVARCDCDCDGRVNANDIGAFIAALSGPAGFEAAYPDCPHLNADADRSGAVDFDDMPAFIGCLVARGGGEIKAELAGRPLASFPYFQYVNVVQATDPLYVALDPSRFPELLGRTVDVYVVASRSAELWSSEPHLIDVTPHGPLTMTIVGGGIQQNTRMLAQAGELASVGGAGLGVGYDVVLDGNRNGLLDAGDLIDGRGDAAAFYCVGDLTRAGPRPWAELVRTASAAGLPPGRSFAPGSSCAVTSDPCNRQKIFFPTDCQPDERLPLVVISHGNTHNLRWYDYLGRQLASRGRIVLAHAVNAKPGPYAAAESTLLHVDAFLGQLGVIAEGALAPHVDSSRMVWIGHSRGGEGVVLARDQLERDPPGYAAVSYGAADVLALVALAPTDFSGPQGNQPGATPFLLLYGAADGDVHGGPDEQAAMPLSVFERASGMKAAAYLHGAAHNYFNCCGLRDWSGAPGFDLTRALTQRITRATITAFLAAVLDDDPAAGDYLWRQFEDLRPQGVPERTPDGHVVTVNREYRLGSAHPGRFVIEDHRAQPDPGVSSSGGAVTYTVLNLAETALLDGDQTFAYSSADRAQGMTRSKPGDLARCVTFEAPAGVNTYLEYELPAVIRDLRAYEFLSFRACQITRAPLTAAVLADVTFSVSLRDAAGQVRTLDIGAYGGGIEEPYGRAGAGAGLGWANEFETIRLRLRDFLRNGGALDLGQVVAVRFNFGPSHGSDGLHLGLADLEVTGE